MGATRSAGLLIAGLASMIGIVLAVNLSLYGTAGAFGGVGLLALGTVGTVVSFRGPRSRDGR